MIIKWFIIYIWHSVVNYNMFKMLISETCIRNYIKVTNETSNF